MCNGYRHPPGCNCAFSGGPRPGHRGGKRSPQDPDKRKKQGGGSGCRFTAQIRESRVTPWTERVIRNERNLIQSMREEGRNEKEIAKALKEYRKAKLPLDSKTWRGLKDEDRKGLVRTVKRMLGFRESRVENTKTKTEYIPLFVFSAPPVPNSLVTYREESETEKKVNWVVSVSVPSVGFGTGRDFQVKGSCSFECKGGESKMVYIPVTLRISSIGIYRKGKRIRDGKVRITVVRNRYGSINRIPKDCDIKRFKKSPQIASRFPLTKIKASDFGEYGDQWIKSHPTSFQIGINLFGVQTALSASIRLKRQVGLTYRLPGGRNYYLHELVDTNGIAWVVRGKKRATGKRGELSQ